MITWKCDGCGSAIEGDDGYLHVPMTEVHQYEEAAAEWESKYRPEGYEGVTMADLAEHPSPARWLAHHTRCDPTEGVPYVIGIDELRTPWALVQWSAHLMEKTWLSSTNWDTVLAAKYAARETFE